MNFLKYITNNIYNLKNKNVHQSTLAIMIYH